MAAQTDDFDDGLDDDILGIRVARYGVSSGK
jgi:hypothetical protein